MIPYVIFGLPGDSAGLRFSSPIYGLEKKPYLWEYECPFPIPADVMPQVVALSDLEQDQAEFA